MLLNRTFAGLTAAGLFALAASNVHAGVVIDDGSGGSIPDASQINDVFGDSSASAPGGFGSNLYFDGLTRVRFTFLGAEADYNNRFNVNGSTIFSNSGTRLGASAEFTFGSGAADGTADGSLPFSFISGTGPGVAVNGSNPDDSVLNGSGVNFFVATDTAKFGSGLFLGYDDTYTAGDDDDHDDMGIFVEELSFSELSTEQAEQIEVPAPATLVLLGAGLLGLRRSLRQAQPA